MANRRPRSHRPFISYATVDRPIVEAVLHRLVRAGMLPVYDLWWLRTTVDDTARSEREVRAGIGHSDGYVQFRSEASRGSPWMKFENDYLLEEKCKRDEGSYRAVCVLLGDTSPHVETWYDATVRIQTQDPASEAFGRSVAELIAAIAGSHASDATAGIAGGGAETIAALLAALDDESLDVRSRAAVLLSFLHGPQLDQAQVGNVTAVHAGALSATDPEIAHSALRGIGALGPRAIAATPALARFLRGHASPTLRAQATIALNRIGPTAEAVAALAAAAANPRSGIQLAALTQLGVWGSAASAAVPALIELADSDDTHLRIVTLTALGSIGNPTTAALVAVLEAIVSDEAQLHHVGLRTLSQMAPPIDLLARAIVGARSWTVRSWLRERWPAQTTALDAGGMAEDRLTAAREVAHALLGGSRMIY